MEVACTRPLHNCASQDSNLRPASRKSDALSIVPPCHLFAVSIKLISQSDSCNDCASCVANFLIVYFRHLLIIASVNVYSDCNGNRNN